MSTSALRHYPLERNSYAMCARGLIIARLGIRYLIVLAHTQGSVIVCPGRKNIGGRG